MVAVLLAIVCILVTLAVADAENFSHCFVPVATFATTAARRDATRTDALTLTRLPLSSPNNEKKSGNRTYDAKKYTPARIPRHHEEAVGITGGLGLWTELRRRTRRRRRKLLGDKWNSYRSKRSGRRRKRLSERLKTILSRDKSSSSSSEIEDEDEVLDSEQDEGEFSGTSLDAMLARSGVLRTRIRLRQESLSELEKLTMDVRYEMKRDQWKNVFDANAGYTNRTTFMYGQAKKKEDADENDTENVMNEFELASINKKWKERQINENAEENAKKVELSAEQQPDNLMEELQLGRMLRRSRKLENSILLDRIRLQRLERRIMCFESSELGILERAVGNTLDSLNDMESNPAMLAKRQAKKFVNTFGESTSVLLRKLDRVQSQRGPNNNYASVTDFVVQETAAGVRIVGNLLSNPSQLSQLVDPETPTLVPHVPAILARLDRLESHVAPILSRVLNNKRHLRTIEPYLDEILERFDDIEPHLPWILDHIDTLAPYTGLLLKHIDELLLYAEVDEYEAECGSKKNNYAFAEQLLPYLEVYVSQLDLVGPHLPLLRPHLPLLLKHSRIKILSPHVGILFGKGYKDLSASANMDVLLFYFGWALRIPFVPRLFFSFPGSPGMVSFLANRLPKRFVRGQCCDVSCYVDGDYGAGWNELSK